MLVKRRVTQVDLGQKFYYYGREYVLATPEERQGGHPADGREAVLAYCLADKGGRIPVGFNPLADVFIDQKLFD